MPHMIEIKMSNSMYTDKQVVQCSECLYNGDKFPNFPNTKKNNYIKCLRKGIIFSMEPIPLVTFK